MDEFPTTIENNAQLAKPVPRRPGANFSLTPISTSSTGASSEPSSEPPSAGPDSGLLNASFGNGSSRRSSGVNIANNGTATPSSANPPQRNRSILNLTSSTLFGIYSPTIYDANREAPETPWGTGAQTPAPRPSTDSNASFFNSDLLRERTLASLSARPSKIRTLSHSSQRPPHIRKKTVFGTISRSMLLFGIGLAYGGLVSHFHDTRNLAPVKVDRLDRSDWRYYLFWAVVAVALGNLMPFVDRWWDAKQSNANGSASGMVHPIREKDSIADDDGTEHREGLAGDWIAVFRTIGAFVGIAFAIRRLPWQSTLQLSATLALINPALWYLLDRTMTGLALASTICIFGAGTVLSINPALVPQPPPRGAPSRPPSASSFLNRAAVYSGYGSSNIGADSGIGGGGISGIAAMDKWLSYETLGVVTWIGSVLFCACICFGNIGRRVGL